MQHHQGLFQTTEYLIKSAFRAYKILLKQKRLCFKSLVVHIKNDQPIEKLTAILQKENNYNEIATIGKYENVLALRKRQRLD